MSVFNNYSLIWNFFSVQSLTKIENLQEKALKIYLENLCNEIWI